MGGPFGPSVSRSPEVTPQQGGPWAPPPCIEQIPGDVDGSSVCFPVWSWFLSFGCLFRVFCLWGWYFVWSLSPSSPDPCLVFCMCPSFFFCLVHASPPCFLSFFFLALSLSLRCWGNPNLFGLGFPLCSLPPAHALRPRPVLRVPHLHLGEAPAPVFFCYVAVARCPCRVFFLLVSLVVVGLVLSWLFWASLPLSLSLWFYAGALWVCMHVSERERDGVAYKTAPPFIIIIIVFWGCEHGAVSRTLRPEPLVLPPPPPAVP